MFVFLGNSCIKIHFAALSAVHSYRDTAEGVM